MKRLPFTRAAALAAFVALSSALSWDVAAQEQNGAPADCNPADERVSSDSDRIVSPTPSLDLRRAVARFKVRDRHASFGFAACEVDSFATRAKPTIPDYAKDVLLAAGMSTTPRRPEFIPDPTKGRKPSQDLDAAPLLSHRLSLPEEPEPAQPPVPSGEPSDTAENDPQPGNPILEERVLPPIARGPKRPDFQPPSDATRRLEASLVRPILKEFLARHNDVFRLGEEELGAGLPGLQQTRYEVGRYFRKAAFTQTVGGELVLGSKTLVLFDVNWNVIGISRTLLTPTKLAVPPAPSIERARAEEIALAAVLALTGRTGAPVGVGNATLGLDPVRRLRAWEIAVLTPQHLPDPLDFTVLMRADTGEVLNISDNIMVFTDAKVRRWGYANGDVTQPLQYIATGIYTKGSDTLRSNYFNLETDERGGGSLEPCFGFGPDTDWREGAYGTTNSPDSFIRHTHRTDRNFSIWSPAHDDGTFGESHAYYWSQRYFAWMRDALNELGVLPDDPEDYPKTTLIANACINDIGIAGSLDVTIQHNEGEETGKIRLADLCRVPNVFCTPNDYDISQSTHFLTCEGGGCQPSASVIHHELNHHVLAAFFGIGSGLDCGTQMQGKFIHEGLLGSVLPQAFWHYWYGVGYNPTSNRLFTADQVRGRVHTTSATNLTLSQYWCVDNDGGGQEPYNAGRVAGQPLWEIYHGRLVQGNSILNTYRPATDTDFLILAYQAADLTSASTYPNRQQFARRVMEIIEYSNWPSAAKQDYCEIWAHHELDATINPSYCS